MNFTTFSSALSQYRPNEIVFVGLGNEYRGDDAAGLIFFDRLRESQHFDFSHFVLARTNPENHLEEILSYKPKLVVFIDAARFGGKPGEMQWLEPETVRQVKISTHAFSMDMVEYYLNAQHPMKFKYLGIQPLATEPHEPLSKVVEEKFNEFFGVQTEKRYL